MPAFLSLFFTVSGRMPSIRAISATVRPSIFIAYHNLNIFPSIGKILLDYISH